MMVHHKLEFDETKFDESVKIFNQAIISQIVAGAGPTVTTIIISWIAMYFYAPIVWPDLHSLPEWVHKQVL